MSNEPGRGPSEQFASIPSRLLDSTAEPGLLVAIRFRGSQMLVNEGLAELRAAVQVLAQSPGFRGSSIGQATDDPELLIVTLTWRDIGSYRRALSRYEVKMQVVPLLSRAIDEPTAFEILHAMDEAGELHGTSQRAADADSVRLGEAAQPWVARHQS
ncbi:MAG: antibiotic biosynthesis monooxygenase [Actinomycetales bacterium]